MKKDDTKRKLLTRTLCQARSSHQRSGTHYAMPGGRYCRMHGDLFTKEQGRADAQNHPSRMER